MSVADIIHKVQVEFDDLDGTFVFAADVINFIEIVNEDLESLLENLDLAYDQFQIILPAVAAGTTDLSAFMNTGQPLASMMFPVALEWKLPSDNNISWRPIPQQDQVEDVLTGTAGGPSATEGIASYEWRGGIIYISPSSVPTDIRVRGEALPAVLDSDSAYYIRGASNVLMYAVCKQFAAMRGGGMAKDVAYYQSLYDDAMSNFSDRLVKQEQNTSRRMAGRRSQQPGPLWRMPMG